MLGSPPLPHPVGERVVRVRRRVQRIVRVVFWSLFLRRVVQKKKREAGRRQRRDLFRVVWGLVLLAVGLGLTAVMVLMVAMAVWGAPLRGMLEGRREQVGYGPGVVGGQLGSWWPVSGVAGSGGWGGGGGGGGDGVVAGVVEGGVVEGGGAGVGEG